ncbi:MAG TPA: aryl-sulfate sulfotransferase, partial [Chitinophagales bacterium]|nr:aryl-sulfate sulfotransferase [Chitinophagales bacterium]
YTYPLPGSSYHHPQVAIILTNGNLIDPTSVNDQALLEIYGSKSGHHQWHAKLSDDHKTITIKTTPIFEYGETVVVTVNPKLRTTHGEKIEGTTFTFHTRNAVTPEEELRFEQARLAIAAEEDGGSITSKTYPLDGMPTFTINVNTDPAPGSVFYANHSEGAADVSDPFLTILKNNGKIKWAREAPGEGRDFKINENGYLTYFKNSPGRYMIMDSNYNIIDSVQCVNGGYKTDSHDCMIYPDGHALLIGTDEQTVDMTPYGGQPNATVEGLIIQELDSMKNLVFEWRSWDHFQFTDANSYVPLTTSVVDYCHGNSVQRDDDGNILISSRNMNECTKINRATGNIMWRLGGENNQFTFVNDNIPEHFHSQHYLRRLPNGNIILFNNGNFLPVQVSSVKEYSLDETNKIATLVWYYEHPDVNGVHVYGSARGNAQRLPNGNTLINWGLIGAAGGSGIPNFTEVDYNKNIVWEMTFDAVDLKIYRAHKYVWKPCSRITGSTMTAEPNVHKATLKWGKATGASSYLVEYNETGNTEVTTLAVENRKITLKNLSPATVYEWRVKTVCDGNSNSPSGYSPLKTFTTLPQKAADFSSRVKLIDVYPVPSTDKVYIEYKGNEKATVSIINALGNQLIGFEIDDHNKFPVDIQNWPAGIYFIRINTTSQVWVERMIKE